MTPPIPDLPHPAGLAPAPADPFGFDAAGPDESLCGRPHHGGMVVGVTASRFSACKRGIAANLAARQAALVDEPGVVAGYDVDHERDMSDRLLVGPVSTIASWAPGARVVWPPIDVVRAPVERRTLQIDLHQAGAGIEMLRYAYDVVVADLPLGTGRPGPTLDSGLVDQLDVLLVATACRQSALDATLRHLDLFAQACARRHAPVPVAVVLTGDESINELAPEAAAAQVREVGAEVAGVIPQWWGRNAPGPGFGPTLGVPALDEAFDAVWARVCSLCVSIVGERV